MGFSITSTIACPVTVTNGIVSNYTTTPYAKQSADQVNELGNVADREYFGAGDIVHHEVVYELKCDSSIGSVTIGANGLESIAINTDNGNWPTVTIGWYTGLPTCQAGATFTVTLPSVQGKRKAQALGLTNSGGTITSSNWSASAELSLLLDEDGEPAAYAFSGCEIETSAEATDGTFTAASGLEITSSPSTETKNAFGTVSATATGYVTGSEVSASSGTSTGNS